MRAYVLVFVLLTVLFVGCGSGSAETGNVPDASSDDGTIGGSDDGGPSPSWPMVDGGYALDGSILPADRFVTNVTSFTPGTCAGFGESGMPDVVKGPPIGGGSFAGSVDVVSLGGGGEIVVSFEPNAIVDGPGVDFIVFENPFWIGGDPNHIYDELGEISVSDDGTNWSVFPCTAPQGAPPPYGQCGGWRVVYSNPINGVDPLDPSVAGGDLYDLADLGLQHVRFVRIRDKTQETCPDAGSKPNSNGFDLDAVGIVHAQMP